ncbi:DUF2062 domain-containing protein [Halocynthiibacter namhaensis]|uniref:DUF2062 domain-containing protein n=1 Tax=Halocynthiibacter namhaensis TaxID=1290553 RepID=UPI0009DD6439
MVFKRRDKRPNLVVVRNFLWPRSGWKRAYQYVKLRLHRLPDPPHRIARGVFAGVFTSFTPFFGLHFFVAMFIAKMMRGNILAALLATFFGNPLTFPFIAASSLKLGQYILSLLGRDASSDGQAHDVGVGVTLWHNFLAIFTEQDANWSFLWDFYNSVFLPYLVGGLIPGLISGVVCYYMTVPVIDLYQKRRKGRLMQKFEELRAKKAAKAAEDAAVAAAQKAEKARAKWEDARDAAEMAAEESARVQEEMAQKAADLPERGE